MRALLRVVALIAAASVVIACSSPEAPPPEPYVPPPGVTDTEIRLGTHQPLTGPEAGYSRVSVAMKAYFDHVNAHATSTPEGDKAELQAIKTILGEHAASVPVTANKSMIGHTLGAAGAIESIATIMTIRESCIPPSLNLQDQDPEAAGTLIVAGEAKRHGVRVALSNSFGFGGQNTALLFRRWDG